MSEFFVFKEFLIEKAKNHSLQVLDDNSILNFSNWYIKYISDKRNQKLSYQEQVVSFFNFSFIFIKV